MRKVLFAYLFIIAVTNVVIYRALRPIQGLCTIDSAFHVQIAKSIGWHRVESFEWLPLTSLHDKYCDRHYLLHAVTWVFLQISDSAGALLYVMCVNTLLYAFFFRFVSNRIELRIVFTLLFLTASPMALLVFSQVHPIPVVLVSILLLLHFYQTGCHWAFIPLIAVTLLFYVGGIILALVILAILLAEGISSRTISACCYAAFGFALALAVHPYSSVIVSDFISFITEKTVPVEWVWTPSEWLSMPGQLYLRHTWPLIAVMLIVIFCFRRICIESSSSLVLAYLVLFTVPAMLYAAKFLPYCIFFMTLLLARLTEESGTNAPSLGGTPLIRQKACIVLCSAVIVIAAVANIPWYYSKSSAYYDRYSDISSAAQWLTKNTSSQEIVYNCQDDIFAFLFYYNPHNRYVSGLDPDFLRRADAEKGRLYEAIGMGLVDDPVHAIGSEFDSSVIIAERGMHPRLVKQLLSDSRVHLMNEGKCYQIFRIENPS